MRAYAAGESPEYGVSAPWRAPHIDDPSSSDLPDQRLYGAFVPSPSFRGGGEQVLAHDMRRSPQTVIDPR